MALVNTSTGEIETCSLEDLEEIIGRGLQSFVEVGEALAKVRDSGLYKEHADTFEAYCSTRWGLSRPRAYELMHAAEAVSAIADIEPSAPVPINEAQARQLAPLKEDPPKMAAAMSAAAAATGGKPTAAAIKEAVAEQINPKAADRERAQEVLDDLLDNDADVQAARRLNKLDKVVHRLWEARCALDDAHPADFNGDHLRELQGLSESLARFVGGMKAERRKLKSIDGGKS